MSDNRHFDQLVAKGNPVGEIIAVNRFLVRIKGLNPSNVHALVMFEDGSKGFIHQVQADHVIVLCLSATSLSVGMTAVLQHTELVTKVGKDFIGRVVSVTGDPLDGKGPVAVDAVRPVFADAPPLYGRELLDKQLETGITVVDALFPIARGQRMAILGDNKSGKTTMATQMAMFQQNEELVVIYVLIAKRRSDVDQLLERLESSGAIKHTIVVVATMLESLVMNYLAPYVGCAIGEYLWQQCDQDVFIIYDDLTSHAHVYREIALLSGSSPGRESYPGDMFYAHASLLERAGKLAQNHKTQSVLALVLTPGGDITAYLPTNIMSITDGQWIMDMEVFRDSYRPALSIGLSVTRVGGRGHNDRQKAQAARLQLLLASFTQARQYSHFGTELAVEAQDSLNFGQQLYKLFNQKPSEAFPVLSQQLMLDVLLSLNKGDLLDVDALKLAVNDSAKSVQNDADFDRASAELKAKVVIHKTAEKRSENP